MPSPTPTCCPTEKEVVRSDGRGNEEASQASHSSLEVEKVEWESRATKTKGKDETKVQKFFKRLKKLVTKETKVNEEEDIKRPRKMARSLSHRIGKPKNLPK